MIRREKSRPSEKLSSLSSSARESSSALLPGSGGADTQLSDLGSPAWASRGDEARTASRWRATSCDSPISVRKRPDSPPPYVRRDAGNMVPARGWSESVALAAPFTNLATNSCSGIGRSSAKPRCAKICRASASSQPISKRLHSTEKPAGVMPHTPSPSAGARPA
ncbi:hypothetical protein T492DRAFT_976487 [Pavlovales sp. CCMP2436]|nr:hypothetical protein T492DRAFT_976487 [Pavlovales sp. CCMP2436]